MRADEDNGDLARPHRQERVVKRPRRVAADDEGLLLHLELRPGDGVRAADGDGHGVAHLGRRAAALLLDELGDAVGQRHRRERRLDRHVVEQRRGRRDGAVAQRRGEGDIGRDVQQGALAFSHGEQADFEPEHERRDAGGDRDGALLFDEAERAEARRIELVVAAAGGRRSRGIVAVRAALGLRAAAARVDREQVVGDDALRHGAREVRTVTGSDDMLPNAEAQRLCREREQRLHGRRRVRWHRRWRRGRHDGVTVRFRVCSRSICSVAAEEQSSAT
mmetsp:Transcript_119/g.444  ORF Transcript_119/g.444 Transcript_119/m.444 type:complete len:277 (-) Transcript_119:95-925(-)